jgi:hypothetical protein
MNRSISRDTRPVFWLHPDFQPRIVEGSENSGIETPTPTAFGSGAGALVVRTAGDVYGFFNSEDIVFSCG